MASVHSFIGRRILNGDLTYFELSDEGYIPWEVAGIPKVDDHVLHPGIEDETNEKILPAIVEIAERVTPGVTWLLAPRLLGCNGMALGHPNAPHPVPVIYLSTRDHARSTVKVAYHEAEHAIEDLLTPEELAILDAAVARGDGWNDAYGDSFVERRAELFAHASMLIRHGGTLTMSAAAPEVKVISDIYHGVVGRRRLKRQKVCAPVAAPKQPISVRIAHWLGLTGFGEWLGTPAG